MPGHMINRSLINYLIFILLAGPLAVSAQSPMGDIDENYQYDERAGRKWTEKSPGDLPAYPNDRNLVLFNTAPSGMEYLADLVSIMPGKDNIVRLTVVAKSPSNSRTVFFEGYHCGTKRYKRYAVAGAEGPLVSLDNPGWQVIIDVPEERFRQDLLSLILCTQLYTAAPKNIIVDRFKYKTYREDNYDD